MAGSRPDPEDPQASLFTYGGDHRASVGAAPVERWRALAARLPRPLFLGTSSWSFPGWRGLVWDSDYDAARLARDGLRAYASHPLLRTVSLDRGFYRALDTASYAALVAQVPVDFRFVVKAPAAVTDCALRSPGTGQPKAMNPEFLDADLAVRTFVAPAVAGLGERIGALVFQLSPLGSDGIGHRDRVLESLGRMLAACRLAAGNAVIAVEVRDAELLGPELADVLRRGHATYCLGLHDRLPPITDQLPMLRALWPGPLVVRWSLQRGLRYATAKARFEPFDRLCAPDPATRAELARVVAATLRAGQPALVAINNKAEGSAPLSVIALAEAIEQRLEAART